MPCLECALSVEKKYLSEGSKAGVTYSRVVWMLVTDAPDLKQWICGLYSSQDASVGIVADKDHHRSATEVTPREILTTTATGVQTRTGRNPSTEDFAQAFIDWYLIGESDVVVSSSHRHSFGITASLRTARPLFDPLNCTEFPRFGPPRFNSEDEMREAMKPKTKMQATEHKNAKKSQ